MHLVYSALKPTDQPKNKTKNRVKLKYKAYQTTCNNYAHEIAAIQKYIPGWKPAFNY